MTVPGSAALANFSIRSGLFEGEQMFLFAYFGLCPTQLLLLSSCLCEMYIAGGLIHQEKRESYNNNIPPPAADTVPGAGGDFSMWSNRGNYGSFSKKSKNLLRK